MLAQIESSPAAVPGMSLLDIRRYLTADGRPVEQADELVRAHGVKVAIGETDRQLVPIDVCWRIFSEHAALTDDEMHGIFGTRLKLGTTNLFVARMLLCETVLDAINAYKEAYSVMVPDLGVTVTRREDSVSLRWRYVREGEVHLIALEGMATVYYAIISWLAGEALPVQRVRAPAIRKGSRSTLLGVFNAPVAYSGDDLELFFAPQAAEARIKPRDIRGWHDGVYQMLCSAALRDCAARHGGAFTNKVRSAMLRGVDQQSLADQWGVSTKTIARRLEQEGYTFRRVRDEVRMQKSTSLIHAGLTIETIGELLGYEDTRSFRRAFKRWFGVSPSAFRERAVMAR